MGFDAAAMVNMENLDASRQQYRKALARLYKVVQSEMKDWLLDDDIKDELRDALREAKTALYATKGSL